jgi:hypothetical protein
MSLSLEAFTCLEVWLGHDGPVLLSVVAQALFCNLLCVDFSPSPGDAVEAVSGKSRLLSA